MQNPTIPTQLSLRPGIFSDWFSFPSFCLCKCYGAREVLQVIFKHILLRKKDLSLQCVSYREGETPRSLTSARWSRPVIALVRVRLTTVVSPRASILGVCASRRITSCPTIAFPMFLRSSPMKAVLLSLLSSNSTVTRFDFSLSVSTPNESYQTSRTFFLQEFEAAKKMGSSGPGQNSVDSLDTVNKNTSSASRAYLETYFLQGGDTVEPWVSRRPHGQHGGK